MEIGPVAGIRIMPVAKAQPADPELNAFLVIEPSAKTGDDSYTGTSRKGAGAEESGEEPEEIDEILDGDSEPEPMAARPEEEPQGKISFFA